jgi:hypothetical protein
MHALQNSGSYCEEKTIDSFQMFLKGVPDSNPMNIIDWSQVSSLRRLCLQLLLIW